MKEKISNLELSSIVYFITRSFLIGVTFNSILYSTKQNSWMIPLFSLIIGFIFIFLLDYIMSYKPNLDINQKINKLFKNTSNILIIIITVILFLACTLNFLNLSNFIQSEFLNRTPILALLIIFSIAIYYVVSKGINTISRTSNILFYISIFLLFITIIGLISNIKISNLEPFFNLKIENYVKSMNTFYTFHICPLFILTIIPKNKIENKKIRKTIFLSYLFSTITICIAILSTISIFGYRLAMLFEYPLFHILKHISITGFTYRVESLLVIQLIFDFFICHVLLIYFICSNLKHLTKSKNVNLWNIITCILIIISTLFFSRYSIYLDELLKSIIPIVISIISTIIIFIICIKIKISN